MSASLKPNMQFSPQSSLIVLETPWKLVVNFVRQFSLYSRFVSVSFEPTGLLLYGLQGCGKRRILEMVAGAEALSDEDKMVTHFSAEFHYRLCRNGIDIFIFWLSP